MLQQTDTEFKAFSPDLCQGWLQSVAEPPLATRAPRQAFTDLYRRSDEECGGPGYEALNTTAPPSKRGGTMELQGLSERRRDRDLHGERRAGAGREHGDLPDSTAGGGEEHFLCVLPGGAAYAKSCTVGGA